ncbi:protein DENND6B [Rhodnius prolixus]
MASGGAERPNDETDGEASQKPWERFSAWVHAVCIVTFDLELGQALEVFYPSSAKLSEEDKTNICYLAFPDSNSGCMGDTQFHFRFRHIPHDSSPASAHIRYNPNSGVSLLANRNFLYGYVYFRQVKDPSLPRGYFQKSVIILSKYPFVNLFLTICRMIAPEFFENGPLSIEAACHEIDHWPEPVTGEIVSLPLLGTVLQVQIPGDISLGNAAILQSVCSNTVIPCVHLNNLFSCFSNCIYHIQLLWELVLIGEPIVVMASSPETCSQMVHALVTMIMPLIYCGEHRPYFTIHDMEFKEYTKTTQPPPPTIIGVTNPFFSKTLQHWPHIIKLPEPAKSSTLQKSKIKKGVVKAFDSKSGVYTQYEPFLQKDKAIVKKLLKGIQTNRPEEVQSALLRRHLLELTQSFMIPLERYMATLMPLHKNISPYKAAPTPWPFNPEAFIASLDKSGPQLTTGIKGNWEGLYRRFFRSPNFIGWYNTRYKAMNEKLQILQLEALSEADLRRWVADKQEVEIVDMLIKIRCKLNDCRTRNVRLSETVYRRLQRRMEEIVLTLPEDLRSVLESNATNS